MALEPGIDVGPLQPAREAPDREQQAECGHPHRSPRQEFGGDTRGDKRNEDRDGGGSGQVSEHPDREM